MAYKVLGDRSKRFRLGRVMVMKTSLLVREGFPDAGKGRTPCCATSKDRKKKMLCISLKIRMTVTRMCESYFLHPLEKKSLHVDLALPGDYQASLGNIFMKKRVIKLESFLRGLNYVDSVSPGP